MTIPVSQLLADEPVTPQTSAGQSPSFSHDNTVNNNASPAHFQSGSSHLSIISEDHTSSSSAYSSAYSALESQSVSSRQSVSSAHSGLESQSVSSMHSASSTPSGLESQSVSSRQSISSASDSQGNHVEHYGMEENGWWTSDEGTGTRSRPLSTSSAELPYNYSTDSITLQMPGSSSTDDFQVLHVQCCLESIISSNSIWAILVLMFVA